MPTVSKPKSAAGTTAVVLRITSPTPLPVDELRRRAQAVLQAAGLEAAPAPAAKTPAPRRAARPALTKEAAWAELERVTIAIADRAAQSPPISEEDIVAEVQLVRKERYERAQAKTK